MFKRLFCSALVFGAAALAPPATAQTLPCVPRDSLAEGLAQTYGERQIGAGLQGPFRLVEVWTSAETGTFTIFITEPGGWSCIVATGDHWFVADPPPETGPDEGVAG